MSFRSVFTFDPRLAGHDQGSVGEVRVENQRSCIPEGGGLRSGQADCARVRLEWKWSSSPSMRMAGRASPAALFSSGTAARHAYQLIWSGRPSS
jgi:hypothetical protein